MTRAKREFSPCVCVKALSHSFASGKNTRARLSSALLWFVEFPTETTRIDAANFFGGFYSGGHFGNLARDLNRPCELHRAVMRLLFSFFL